MSAVAEVKTDSAGRFAPGEKQCPICRGAGVLSVATKPGPSYDKPLAENVGCYRCTGKGIIKEILPPS